MSVYDFIFSAKFSHRILRHVVFWIIFLFYFSYVNFFPTKPEDFRNIKTYVDAFELMIFFPVSFISVYVTIYFILPAYVLTSRYMEFALAIIIFILINFSIAYLLTVLLAKMTSDIPFNQLPMTFRWFLPIRYGIGLPLTSAALTAIIKLLKTWHLKQKENEYLLQQKVKNEIQLLKTQFQPHFLYNTLQKISLLVQKDSASVPSTLLQLSELLSYLLHEVEKDEVPMVQEIQMIKNFLSLKKTFHDQKLTINFEQESAFENQTINPLLFISLIECFFTTFIDVSGETHTVNIAVKADGHDLILLLRCRKDHGESFSNKKGNDWWKAPLKKVELLYPYSHRFETYTENNKTSFTLILETLSIQKQPGMIKDKSFLQHEPA